MSNLIVAQLLYLESENPEKDIALYINSPGGSVSAGLAIYDTMQFIKPDVSTICVGLAASMGAVLLAAARPASAMPCRTRNHDSPAFGGLPGPGVRYRHPCPGRDGTKQRLKWHIGQTHRPNARAHQTGQRPGQLHDLGSRPGIRFDRFHARETRRAAVKGLIRAWFTARETLSLREVGRVLYSRYCSCFLRGFREARSI